MKSKFHATESMDKRWKVIDSEDKMRKSIQSLY